MGKLEMQLEQDSTDHERLGDFIPKARDGAAEGFRAEEIVNVHLETILPTTLWLSIF